MKAPRSLSLRVSLYLLCALFLGPIVFWALYVGASLAGIAGNIYMNPEDLAAHAVHRLVLQSVFTSADGSRSIRPTAALAAQIERTPTLRYAVFDMHGRQALSGSSDELIAALGSFARVLPTGGKLDLVVTIDDELVAGQLATDDWTIVAVSGYQFEWSNFPIAMLGELSAALRWSVPAFLFGVILIWISVKQGLAPLRRAALQAENISIESLQQRLPKDGMPDEVVPLIEALNDALGRVDAGVARQRRFIANAAHELRTPIAALRARMEDVERGEVKTDLLRLSRHLKAVVDQLLASARLSERKTSIAQDIDLAAILLSQVADFTPLAIQCGREIEFRGPASGIAFSGDKLAIESILANLIDNALRAEPRGSAIIVHVDACGIVEIIDHGEGVLEADRQLIFEPFWRKSEGSSGAGLGLAIVKELVEFHDGTIAMKETKGGGATFIVDLSRRVAHESSNAVARSEE